LLNILLGRRAKPGSFDFVYFLIPSLYRWATAAPGCWISYGSFLTGARHLKIVAVAASVNSLGVILVFADWRSESFWRYIEDLTYVTLVNLVEEWQNECDMSPEEKNCYNWQREWCLRGWLSLLLHTYCNARGLIGSYCLANWEWVYLLEAVMWPSTNQKDKNMCHDQ
jgi:hypothetical protein